MRRLTSRTHFRTEQESIYIDPDAYKARNQESRKGPSSMKVKPINKNGL
jgi:hypothetical protein